MLKKYKYILVFAIINSFFGNSQNYKLKYKVTEFKELNESDYSSKKKYLNFQQEFNLAKRYLKTIEIDVIITKKGHYYQIEKKLENDFSPNPFLASLFIGYAGLKDNFYYHNNDSYYYAPDETFITKLGHSNYSWEILPKQISKQGYDCFKANFINVSDLKEDFSSNGLKIFFTQDLNINAGPTIFANVPGLIIELENKFLKINLVEITNYKDTVLTFNDFKGDKDILNHDKAQDYYKKLHQSRTN